MSKPKPIKISSRAMIPIAATVFGEAGNQDYKTKVKVASAILNRFESGKKEFGADTGNISDVLNKGFDAARMKSKQYMMAINQNFPDQESERKFKESMGVVSGLLKTAIDREPGEFFMTQKGLANAKKKKLMDFSKVNDLGKSGDFQFFGYPSAVQKGMANRDVPANPVQ